MSTDKSLYIIAELDAEAQRALNGVYGALTAEGITGRQTPDIPYHITLGRYAVKREAEVKALFTNACASLRAFDMRLGALGLFGLNVLYASPVPSAALLALFDAFEAHNLDFREEWMPHVTLLIDEPDTLLRALPIAARRFAPMTARVEKVSLYEFFPKRLLMEHMLR